MNVQDVMTENPSTVRASTPVGDVAELLTELDVRHLPVMEGDTLVGIISDRDLRSVSSPRLLDQEGLDDLKARYDQPISELMVHDVIKVYPETEIVEVIDIMLESKVGAIPVVDASTGDLVGIVSYVDVLRGLREEMED